jgi:hypothetical protein
MEDAVWKSEWRPRSNHGRRSFWIALGVALIVHLIVLAALQLPNVRRVRHVRQAPLRVSVEAPARARRPAPKPAASVQSEPVKRPAPPPVRKPQPQSQPHRPVQPSPPVERPTTPIKTQALTGKINADAWAREAAKEALKAKRKRAFDKPAPVPFASRPRQPLPALRHRQPPHSSTPARVIGSHYRISKVGDQCYATPVSPPSSSLPWALGGLPPRDPNFKARAIRCPGAPQEESFAEGLAR